MKIKNEKDFWSGLMFVVVGIGFTIGAMEYSFGTSARPGPGYFPFGLGILTAVLGAILTFKALTIEVEGGEKVGAFAWRPLGIIVLSVVLFGWALPHLGMWIALPLLIISSAWAGDEFGWIGAIINAAVLTVASYAIFIYGLNLTIPLWPSFIK